MDTKPEVQLRNRLFRMGFRYRLHAHRLPGSPDLVLTKYHAVIFVHGCFWHRHAGCRYTTVPRHNHAFWMEKFQANVDRDERQIQELRAAGWRIAVVWECAVRNNPDSAAQTVARWLTGNKDTLAVGDPVK